jgi:polysaccharide biosynthesis/export protein
MTTYHVPFLLITAVLAGALNQVCVGQQLNADATGSPAISPLSALSDLQSRPGEAYTIGEGDQIDIQVIGRPELSGSHLVGPDGRITLPIAGSFDIRDMTREDAAQKITAAFERYYTAVDVTVRVSKYGSNRILVLGHVDQPGVLYFDSTPTLFDVLSRARRATLGPGQSGMPKRCAIFRGKDQVVWIDLKAMMDTGSAVADLRLRRDDVVWVPDEQEDQISVLGEVQRPGMIRLEPRTTLSEVLALSGGLTANAGAAKIEIVRPGLKTTQEIAFKDLMDPHKSVEASLHSGDVVYVQKGTMAKFAYVLQQLAPVSGLLLFAGTVK